MTFVKQTPVFINNLFDDFLGNLPTQSALNNSLIAVNIHESNDGFTIELNASGRNKEDFKINAEKGILTISYEKKEETENKNYKTLRREFIIKNFKRSFNLDNNVNVDEIKAKYENGILSVFLTKKEEVKVQNKEISIL
jgi:HSP20 family protein